ncbi:hypothetical protein [Parapedobacter tibetensis]|uniref:hypothetical protein n=1 Tax=Parapedobacter tibetensis TaxID=2972951 RepID=UPI00214DCC8A|nr:hypothetical protein [Parapedobacter tibetensis]
MKNKKISAVDYLDGDDFSDDYYGVLTNVQSLLWFITDATEITDWNSFEMMYKQQMNQIPNK